jgi:hypothetical protein
LKAAKEESRIAQESERARAEAAKRIREAAIMMEQAKTIINNQSQTSQTIASVTTFPNLATVDPIDLDEDKDSLASITDSGRYLTLAVA